MCYADVPQRWHYSDLYSGKGQTLNATAFGPECPQNGAGNEDCKSRSPDVCEMKRSLIEMEGLFFNIQTPYIPKANSKSRLKLVMFWICKCIGSHLRSA